MSKYLRCFCSCSEMVWPRFLLDLILTYYPGTVISIHPTSNLEFTSPITKRLHQRDTGLRTSADPSMLVHALLDLSTFPCPISQWLKCSSTTVVDNALEVIDAYHTKINKFERAILLKPQMKTVRRRTFLLPPSWVQTNIAPVHILSGDLILHKRTLEPIKTLIYGLRRYDLDRCAALIDTSDPANANVKVVGFMSHKSKIYLVNSLPEHFQTSTNHGIGRRIRSHGLYLDEPGYVCGGCGEFNCLYIQRQPFIISPGCTILIKPI